MDSVQLEVNTLNRLQCLSLFIFYHTTRQNLDMKEVSFGCYKRTSSVKNDNCE